MKDIAVREISAALAAQAERICRMLLPGGKELKGDWVCGDISGNPGKTLHVHLQGEYAGKWTDWESPDEYRGDLLELWEKVRGCSKAEAIRGAKELLGIHDDISPAKKKLYAKAPEVKESAPSPEGRVSRWLRVDRRILPEVSNRFRVSVDPDRKLVIFPCYNPKGELENRSYRTLPKPGAKKSVWQDKGCAPCLFGWHALPDSARADRSVLICEGQIDAMTWHQWGIPALSVPNGSGLTWIDHEWDNLSGFDRIYLSFDMDGAGGEILKKVMARLGLHRCFIVTIPHKDANDCLLAGCSKEDAAGWIAEAKPPRFDGLAMAAEMAEELCEYIRPKPAPFTLKMFNLEWPWRGLYFREGEVTLWTGASHHGKSTFLNMVILAALVQKMGVFVASLEMPPLSTLQRLVANALQKHVTTLVREDALTFLMEFGEDLVFSNRVGSIPIDLLMEKMRFAFRRHGTSHFIVDSLMRVDGLEENYPAQGEFMNRLQEFAKETGGHIHLVAHPRKLGPGGKPAAMDIKGSSLIPNNADNIVAVVRNMEKNELMRQNPNNPDLSSMPDAEIMVEKQRHSGWCGSFPLKFNPKNFSFAPFEK